MACSAFQALGRGLGGEKMTKEADLNTLLSYRKKNATFAKSVNRV